MRSILACLSLLALGGASALAASALTSIQLLPPEHAQSVAIIAGLEGTPDPERWHIVVVDPKSDTGVRDYVVTAGKISSTRTLTQFAENLTPGDVIAPDLLKVDTDTVSRIAQQFGTANKVKIAAMNYDLRKSGPEATPLWTVTCMDSDGIELGKVIISAVRGTVIMHPGFATEPAIDPVLTKKETPVPVETDDDTPRRKEVRKPTPPKRRPIATPAPTPKPGLFQRMFGR